MKSKTLQFGLVSALALLANCTPITQAADSASTSEMPRLPVGAAATVFDHYFKIQNALAQDSLENVAASAQAIAEIAGKDKTAGFPFQLTVQAEALSKASNVPGARQIFKAVSGYLIQYATTPDLSVGALHEVYCPKVNVNWLQNDKTVRNPYLGKSGPQCGTFKS